MKPILRDGKLIVDLSLRDTQVLKKARQIGELLAAMNQDTGKPLVEAVDAILKPSVAKQDEEE